VEVNGRPTRRARVAGIGSRLPAHVVDRGDVRVESLEYISVARNRKRGKGGTRQLFAGPRGESSNRAFSWGGWIPEGELRIS